MFDDFKVIKNITKITYIKLIISKLREFVCKLFFVLVIIKFFNCFQIFLKKIPKNVSQYKIITNNNVLKYKKFPLNTYTFFFFNNLRFFFI